MDALIAGLEAGLTVVTATARQARHLRWHYDRRRASAGQAAWLAPDILSLKAWLERAWTESLVAGGEAGGHDLLSELQTRLLWEQIMRDRPVGFMPAPPPASVPLVRRAWTLVQDWDLDLGSLTAAAGSPDQQAFAAWAGDYARHCRESGWLDHGGLAGPLARDIQAGRVAVPARLALLGFATRRPALQRLAGALGKAGCAVSWAQPRCAGPAPRAIRFPRREDELSAAARWAAAWLERQPDAVVGLVTPDSRRDGRLRRELLDLLAPGWRQRPADRLPVTPGRGSPLAAAGPVHAALLALELTEPQLDYRHVSQLLRSPYLSGAAEEAPARAALELRLRDQQQREIVRAGLQAAANTAPGFAQLLARAVAATDRAPRRQSLADWAEWISDYLATLGWTTDRPLAVEEERAVEAWQGLLQELAGAGRTGGPVSLGRARRLLASMAREREFEPQAGAGGVQLLTPEAAAGHSFDALWLHGLGSHAWPPPAAPSPLVALALQQRCGLPEATARSHGAWAGELLQGLIGGAGTVIASCARLDADEQLVPGPELAALPALAPGELVLAHRAPEQDALQWLGELVTAADPPPPRRGPDLVRGGSRVLQLQAQCPARAFFEFRLGAVELRPPAFGIDERLRGQLVHDALERLYAALEAAALSPADPHAEAVIGPAVQAALAGLKPGASPLLQRLLELEGERVASRLRALLAAEQQRPPFRVVARETQVECTLGPLQLRLRLDRLDELADGRRLVFDYKTGRLPGARDWWPPRPVEPQLPAYAVASGADGIGFIQLAAGGIRFAGLAGTDTGIGGLKAEGGPPDLDWTALMAAWQEALAGLAAEFAAGDCRIDAHRIEPAAGQFAVLTRVYAAGAGGA